MSTTASKPRTTAKKAKPVEKLRDYKRTVNEVKVIVDIARDEDGNPKLPNSTGGVRFNARDKDAAITSTYVAQKDWAKLGKKESLVVTITANDES